MVRKIKTRIITETVKELCLKANYFLTDDLKEVLASYRQKETSPNAQKILDILQKNAEIAEQEQIPLCQDTGVCVFFVELGRELVIEGDLYQAINEGVSQAYIDGYLRKSMVCDPIERDNTKDNTPAIIHIKLVDGNKLFLRLMVKGAGSENMSAVKMLSPSEGVKGIKKFILETVKQAGSNPCPPIIVGVGLGGNFEMCAKLAKESLLRPIGQYNQNPKIAELEKEMIKEINRLNIGPAGVGGCVTAFDVHIESHPCHIASLPVAININCHAHRHAETVI